MFKVNGKQMSSCHPQRLADNGTLMLQQELGCLTCSQPPHQQAERWWNTDAATWWHLTRLQLTPTPTGWQMMEHWCYNKSMTASPAVNLHPNRLADDGTVMLQHEDVWLTCSQPPPQQAGRWWNRAQHTHLQSTSTPAGWQMMEHWCCNMKRSDSPAVNLYTHRLAGRSLYVSIWLDESRSLSRESLTQASSKDWVLCFIFCFFKRNETLKLYLFYF